MKITSKVIGSVNPETLCRSDGHLLFACGNEVVITGGENGQQLGPVLAVFQSDFWVEPGPRKYYPGSILSNFDVN